MERGRCFQPPGMLSPTAFFPADFIAYRSSRCIAQREVIVNYIVTAFLQLTRQKELPESVDAVTTEQNNLIETIAVNLFTHIVQKLYH